MQDLILYLCESLKDAELDLPLDNINVGCTIIATAVPLMVLCAVLGLFVLAVLSTFNFLRGRKRDI